MDDIQAETSFQSCSQQQPVNREGMKALKIYLSFSSDLTHLRLNLFFFSFCFFQVKIMIKPRTSFTYTKFSIHFRRKEKMESRLANTNKLLHFFKSERKKSIIKVSLLIHYRKILYTYPSKFYFIKQILQAMDVVFLKKNHLITNASKEAEIHYILPTQD